MESRVGYVRPSELSLFERAQLVCALTDPTESCVLLYQRTQLVLTLETLSEALPGCWMA